MNRGRSISRYLCVAGLLTGVVAVVAPTAYGGEDILNDATASVPVDTAGATQVTETQVTETAPAVGEVTNDVSATASTVTGASSATVEQVPAPAQQPAKVVEDVSTSSVAVSTSTPDTPSAPSASASQDVPSSSSEGATTSSGSSPSVSSGDSTSPGSTTSTAGPNQATVGGEGAKSIDATTTWAPPAARGPSSGASSVSAQANDPEGILDELLEIGNSVGVDQVRGLQITNSRGEAAPDAPASPDVSAPAPLALTGIALGAFLTIGLLLLAVGSGARVAGSTISA